MEEGRLGGVRSRLSLEIPRLENSDEEFEGWGEMSRADFEKKIWGVVRSLAERVAELEKAKGGGQDAVRELVEVNKETVAETDKIIRELQDENKKLKAELEENNRRAMEVGREVSEFKQVWKTESEESKVKFSEIIKEQTKAEEQWEKKEKNFTANVVKVIKEKENVIRDTVDKNRTVILFGLEEKEIKEQDVRKERLWSDVTKVLKELDDIGRDWRSEIEEMHRLGLYEANGKRPVKIKLKVKAVAEEISMKAWKLSKDDNLKKYGIRKDMTRNEREELKDRLEGVKQKNEERSEAEKEIFFWKLVGKEVKKWFIRGKTQSRNQQNVTERGRETERQYTGTGEERE